MRAGGDGQQLEEETPRFHRPPAFGSLASAAHGRNSIAWLLLLLLSRFSRVQLCDPIDSSPPGSPVPGILQARTLEWVAISFSNAGKVKSKSVVMSNGTAVPSVGYGGGSMY